MKFEEWKDAELAKNPNYSDSLHDGISHMWHILRVIKLFVLAFFLSHIVLKFNTGYENRDNEIVYDRSLIAKKYLGGAFWFDLLVSFPFEYLKFIPFFEKYYI